MNEQERWAHLVALDDELLRGGVVLSEWCGFIVRQADLAFAGGAHLATILTAVAAIETYLRSEYSDSSRTRLFDLIERAPISQDLRAALHVLRNYRNSWVHVGDPWNDSTLLENPDQAECELEEMALLAIRALRMTIYQNPLL